MSKQGCCMSRQRHAQCLSSVLSIVAVAMSLVVHCRGQVSFSGLRSYAKYPGWDGLSSSGDSLIQLVFRTSSNGLLFYAEGQFEGDSGKEALEIRLEEGRVIIEVQRRVIVREFGGFVIRESMLEKLYLSENLNDNEPHTLSLRQSSSQLTIDIDFSQSVSSTLSTSPIASESLYIGGLPTDVSSQFNTVTVPFSGCLDNIQFTNSSDPGSFGTPEVVEQVGVTDGCPDPCINVTSCGAGECIAVLPDGFFCDCSSTMMGGAYCNEDLSLHQLNLSPENYLCYGLNDFPLIDRAATMRLVPPLPSSGTIMTGVSGTSDHFDLYFQDGVLIFEYSYNKTQVKFRTDQALDGSLTYQIDILLERNLTQLTLSTVEGSQLSEVQQWTEDLIVPVESGVFRTVCLGGSTVTIPYYEGVLERVIFNRVPLSDRSYIGRESVESPTHVISFRREYTNPPLTFDTLTFANNMRLTFEFRMQPDGQVSGTPLMYGTDVVQLSFLVANGQFMIFGTGDQAGFLIPTCSPGPSDLDNNEWHHLDINVTRNSNGSADLRAVVDNNPSVMCETDTDELRMRLGSYLDTLTSSNASLQFGVVRPVGMDGAVANFIGCFQNIEFRETLESSPIIPDLGGFIRSTDRFATGDLESCFSCTSSLDCSGSGGTCGDCGFVYPDQCLSPDSTCPPVPTPSSTTPYIMSTSNQFPLTTTVSPTTPPSQSTTLPTGTGSSVSTLPVGAVVGIAVGGAVLLILVIVVVIILLYVCVRLSSGKQGFYKTEESNGKVASMVHYSASLRQISSEQVTVPETNGVSPMHSDGLRPKEFYL